MYYSATKYTRAVADSNFWVQQPMPRAPSQVRSHVGDALASCGVTPDWSISESDCATVAISPDGLTRIEAVCREVRTTDLTFGIVGLGELREVTLSAANATQIVEDLLPGCSPPESIVCSHGRFTDHLAELPPGTPVERTSAFEVHAFFDCGGLRYVRQGAPKDLHLCAWMAPHSECVARLQAHKTAAEDTLRWSGGGFLIPVDTMAEPLRSSSVEHMMIFPDEPDAYPDPASSPTEITWGSAAFSEQLSHLEVGAPVKRGPDGVVHAFVDSEGDRHVRRDAPAGLYPGEWAPNGGMCAVTAATGPTVSSEDLCASETAVAKFKRLATENMDMSEEAVDRALSDLELKTYKVVRIERDGTAGPPVMVRAANPADAIPADIPRRWVTTINPDYARAEALGGDGQLVCAELVE